MRYRSKKGNKKIAVTTTEYIQRYSGRDYVISTFLATSFDQDLVDWVFRAWPDLNRELGDRWHLFVPTYLPIEDNRSLARYDNFNFDVSRDIMRMYGLEAGDTPCIVLDNYDEQSAQLYVRLDGMDERQLKKFVLQSAGIVRQHRESGRPFDGRNVINDIYDAAQLQATIRGAVKIAPLVGSIVGLAAKFS